MATHKRAETLMDSVCEDMEEKPEPYFSFGIIADIQYADIDNGYNFMKTRMRYYRNSLTLLKEAVQEWDSESTKPKFILQLGDIIDGFNVPQKTSDTSLAIILAEMEKLKIPFHHIWGNHEFYNFKRKYLMESKLNSKPLEDEIGQLTINEDTSETRSDQESFYGYHFSPYPGFRFLLIDCYDLSVIGRDTMSIKYGMSLKLLKEKNPNEDLNSPRGHLPIHLDSTDAICLAWNYKEILSALQSHPCVIGYFAGHDHDGGYSVDASGIHHITFKGVIETPPENQAFGTMYMYEDKMVLKGRGLVLSKTLHYRNGRKEEPVH
ncbi:manganese-dependent ADP-ribose CDP-alcohol diphosphatase isoform X1 [Pelobates cultripes]|uniref:Manganese-dependent ADP-ribose/CDP-alcohol diphosphatase n=1 Tax=Pelobates cultripes TaxID=61616 RepID=A0AAD1W768_PELCU|nr:manganese-dependent ADP-ribose CDP-alcohol diphosphatase isoform X1 [Pelobates cultripes]